MRLVPYWHVFYAFFSKLELSRWRFTAFSLPDKGAFLLRELGF